MNAPPWSAIRLVAFDIDGTLTDATTSWAGEAVGWVQRYSTRDGEAILRLRREGLPTVPLSRNKTRAAHERMSSLGCTLDWLGVSDKMAALRQILDRYDVAAEQVLYVGDGPEDAEVFGAVGLGVAVADAHPSAVQAARFVTAANGGARVMEELAGLLLAQRAPARRDENDRKRPSVSVGTQRMIAVGIMSGTSADGVDAVTVELDPGTPGSAMLLDHRHSPFAPALQNELSDPSSLSVARLSELHALLPTLYAEAVFGLDRLGEAQVCGCHGQTIFHAPPSSGARPGHTLQIGSSAMLAALLQIPVIGDMRAADIARGGEGAPLAPLAHWFFAERRTEATWVVNLGGIANLSRLAESLDDVVGYDLGPGMMLSDGWARFSTEGEMACDLDGALSSGGTIRPEVQDVILSHPFCGQAPPKSTGRDDFGAAFHLPLFEAWKPLPSADVAISLLDVVPRLLVQELERSADLCRPEHIVLTGGGANNPSMLQAFAQRFPSAAVKRETEGLLSPSVHEPAAMALIASRTLRSLPSSLPRVTGAAAPAILGHVSTP